MSLFSDDEACSSWKEDGTSHFSYQELTHNKVFKQNQLLGLIIKEIIFWGGNTFSGF